MRQVIVISAKRSPIGNFGGVFKDISAVQLGVNTLQSMLKETGLKPELIDEVIIGNVCGAGLETKCSKADEAIHSGIPDTVPAYTVNKVCGSGMKAVSCCLMIGSGEADIIVAGGTGKYESRYLML